MHESELMSSVYRSVCSSKTDRRNNSNTPTAITHTLSILTAACMWGRTSGRVCRRNIEVGRSDGWEDSKEKVEDGVWVGKNSRRGGRWKDVKWSQVTQKKLNEVLLNAECLLSLKRSSAKVHRNLTMSGRMVGRWKSVMSHFENIYNYF